MKLEVAPMQPFNADSTLMIIFYFLELCYKWPALIILFPHCRLKTQVPDIKTSLNIVRHLQSKKVGAASHKVQLHENVIL